MTRYIYGIGSGGPTEVTGGITKINIDDPNNLTCEDGEGLYALLGCCLSGDYLYTGSYYYDRLYIYDISVTPIVRKGTTVDNVNNPRGIAVKGDYAFVCSSGINCVAVYDVTDKNNIIFSNKLCGAGYPNYLNLPYVIQIIGGRAYVGSKTDRAITVIDISTPTSISLAGAHQDTTRLHGLSDIFVRESDLYAFTVNWNRQGLSVHDVSDPTSISFIGEKQTSELNGPSGITVDGDYAYVTARNNNALVIFDISTPSSPSYVTKISGSGSPNYLGFPYGLGKVGNYVYVAAAIEPSITAINVSDPENPSYASRIQHAQSCSIGTASLGAAYKVCVGPIIKSQGAAGALPIFSKMLI